MDWWEGHCRLVGSGSIAFTIHTQILVHICTYRDTKTDRQTDKYTYVIRAYAQAHTHIRTHTQ